MSRGGVRWFAILAILLGGTACGPSVDLNQYDGRAAAMTQQVARLATEKARLGWDEARIEEWANGCLDLWGRPFRVVVNREKRELVVCSAGRDGEFSNDDDIEFVGTWSE